MQASKIIVADSSRWMRLRTIDILRSAGYGEVIEARDGHRLLDYTISAEPTAVLVTARLARLSGLEFVRLIRDGYRHVSRRMPIVIMAPDPTPKFAALARDSGVDEILAQPFTDQALLERLNTAIAHQRPFIESPTYVGPCRRSFVMPDYAGPARRLSDPTDDVVTLAGWRADLRREKVLGSVRQIVLLLAGLKPGDRQRLQAAYTTIESTELLAREISDPALAKAARSLARYVSAIGAAGTPDGVIIDAHIDTMIEIAGMKAQDRDEAMLRASDLALMVDRTLGQLRKERRWEVLERDLETGALAEHA